ncbi:hypothetical protein [Pseudoduganella lutea]|uniref:Uncharacterized protein n=1 Tax=Pseudoduganella lutea TaxID=321985 RepID=A0A4V0Z4F3_9BURK|nr:hypothetical protein [Pseudoduganella lutea]QBE66743.1 hypothetical protein EWM63_30365 [Pseudoduganella lutea]
MKKIYNVWIAISMVLLMSSLSVYAFADFSHPSILLGRYVASSRNAQALYADLKIEPGLISWKTSSRSQRCRAKWSLLPEERAGVLLSKSPENLAQFRPGGMMYLIRLVELNCDRHLGEFLFVFNPQGDVAEVNGYGDSEELKSYFVLHKIIPERPVVNDKTRH